MEKKERKKHIHWPAPISAQSCLPTCDQPQPPASPLLPHISFHSLVFAPNHVGLSTSALAGDLDPYPRVFQILNAIPGSVQVSATG